MIGYVLLTIYVLVLSGLLAFLFWILIGEANKYRDLITKIETDKEEKRQTARRRYVSAELKRNVIARDKTTCQICGMSKQYLDSFQNGLGDYLLLEIDHITPVAKGGDGKSLENLQLLCWRCNRTKGKNKTNADVNSLRTYGMEFLEPSTCIPIEPSAVSPEVVL